MTLHRPTGRRGLGLSLALLTVGLWGGLPIAIQVLLRQLDALTILWYRFLVSGVVLGLILASRSKLPSLEGLGFKIWILLAVATLGLFGNYLTYKLSLRHISAGTAQVLMQLGPLMFILGSVAVFGESFSRSQRLGFLTLVVGLLLFFENRLSELFSLKGELFVGVLLCVFSSASWAAYALAQKQLLTRFPSQSLMFLIYAGCAIFCAPFADATSVMRLDALGWGLLIFCALNTLVAYGAFAESLEHWDASRVSAVLSLTPLFSLALVALSSTLWPQVVRAEGLSMISYLGAILVVIGSMVTALGRSP